MDLLRHLTFGGKTRQDFQFVAQFFILENGKSKCVACINTDSKYCIHRTLLRNRLVITNKKVTKKPKRKHCMLVRKKMKKRASARQKCICGTRSLRCKDCVTSILGLFFSSISSFTSYLFSLEIFNTKHNRHPEDALNARHGSRSCKNIAQARER